jgi:hypothetical protein
MKDQSFGSSFTPANKTHAKVLFWLGVAGCVLCIIAIGAAEVSMPDNAGGRKGVVIFYRVFGALLVLESALVGWAYGHGKRMA